MTCVSDRSGSASSGVESVACTPQAASRPVAISTRKRFWIDQRMSEESMLVRPIGGLGRRWHQFRFRSLVSRLTRAGKVVEGAAQARLGVDQKLSGRHDVLTETQAFQNLGTAAVLGADPHQDGAKMRVIVRDDNHAARAGLDDRLARHCQHLLWRSS